MSKNIHLFIMLALGLGVFWWLGQKTQNTVVPLSDIDVEQLQMAGEPRVVDLKDGDTYDMEMTYVRKDIKGKRHTMLAYNNSIPGPVLQVPQNATITLNLTNSTDEETLLHPHGLRLDNRFDGTHLTQEHIKPGETFSYTLTFPDPGMYWYHPHLREDKTQAMGLYGNFWVVPEDENYWSPVNRQVPLMLSDILLSNNEMVPFGDEADHTLMGRFGNTMLINGKTDYELAVKKGEVVRFYLTNVASARPFKFTILDVPLKLVGADAGAYEQETMVDEIVISPAERYIVEAFFESEGEFEIRHDGPQKKYSLGKVTVSEERVEESYVGRFRQLRHNEQLQAEMEEYRQFMDEPVEKSLRLDIDMSAMGHGERRVSLPCHQMPDGSWMGDCDEQEAADMPVRQATAIEWEDDMPMMNRMSNTGNVTWQLVDEDTGAINEDIHWRFNKGDKVKISIFNDAKTDHPMQHPIHFHGQRFLILKHNEEQNGNMAWKDTVLVPAGETVEILLDVTNPGQWMAHCHIPEHLEAGMMLKFDVI